MCVDLCPGEAQNRVENNTIKFSPLSLPPALWKVLEEGHRGG